MRESEPSYLTDEIKQEDRSSEQAPGIDALKRAIHEAIKMALEIERRIDATVRPDPQ